jgi:hypothetical protein
MIDKPSSNKFSEEIIDYFMKNIEKIRELVISGEAGSLLSFIYFILLDNDVASSEKNITTMRFVAHTFITALCFSMIPATADIKTNKIFQKYRENMYQEMIQSINENSINALKEADINVGNDFVHLSTTLH